mmetsp:Transcript_48579/g.90511  ORF Transcript_48579/g.90511 Transcript_48579/m.90511 type:complete len:594 (+) Transcript_48579:148-1929(+)
MLLPQCVAVHSVPCAPSSRFQVARARLYAGNRRLQRRAVARRRQNQNGVHHTREVLVKANIQRGRYLEELSWENTFVTELPGDPDRSTRVRQVVEALYSLVQPTSTDTEPELVIGSTETAELLGMDPDELFRPEFPCIFTGQVVMGGCMPYAQNYGGHQFGNWAGQLGDGRAITLGELVNSEGLRWDVQLKGAGKTPYSRQADGRAVMRSSIREFVASEAMHHLGVPTTRALALCSTGQEVVRDMWYNGNSKKEAGAVVCRVAPSLVRFGTFQLPSSRGGRNDAVGIQLINYMVKHHFPDIEAQGLPLQETAAALLSEIILRTAHVVAWWQSVGFTHGVLNTDNMSALGLTIDYGPFGFMEAFDPQFTPNVTDLDGLMYCFQNQPEAVKFNLVQLANSFMGLGALDGPTAQECLNLWAPSIRKEYFSRMQRKFGFKEYDPELGRDFLLLLLEVKADFTLAFRMLSQLPDPVDALMMTDVNLLKALQPALPMEVSSEDCAKLAQWVRRYLAKLDEDNLDCDERRRMMDASNPLYIPRNYLMQEAIDAFENGDTEPLLLLHKVLKEPYTLQYGMESYSQRAPDWAIKRPGVSILS